MYTFESRVRYSETDESGHLGVAGIIDYMQDCSTFQSEDCRVGVGFLEEHHRAWMLSSWRILIDRLPECGERILAGTWPTSFKGIYGYRNFVLRGLKGESLVRAESVWFLYDTQAGRPIRVQPEDVSPYGPAEEALSFDPAPRKILIPGEDQILFKGEPVRIGRCHLDTNHHVNNARYVELAREVLPEELDVCEIRADYKKAARLGDQLTPLVSRDADTWTVVLRREDGELCAAVWFRADERNIRSLKND
ncbi:MAG: acyl-[acyl-carrier-protein] thioesterase [Clostridiales bacterium]|nr:acyl-[acyl-carrier-protein] thioesterase [Clostridiales bacterium]